MDDDNENKLLINSVLDESVRVPKGARRGACRVRLSPAVAVVLGLLALFNLIGLIVVFATGDPLLWGVEEIWWLVLVDSVAGLFLASFLLFYILVRLAHFVGVRFLTFHVVALVLDFFNYPLASLSGSIGIVFVFRRIVIQSEIDAQLGYMFWSLVAISVILMAKGGHASISNPSLLFLLSCSLRLLFLFLFLFLLVLLLLLLLLLLFSPFATQHAAAQSLPQSRTRTKFAWCFAARAWKRPC
jgi:hypothetical protein